MKSNQLASQLAERFSQLCGLTLQLKPYLTSEKGEICYEVIGKDEEFTPLIKAKLIADLTRAQPHVMPRWTQKMRNPKALSIGKNMIGITDDRRILIPEQMITGLLFAFDPNQRQALDALGKKLTETFNIGSGLRIRCEQKHLMITGQDFQEKDYDTLLRVCSKKFYKLDILAVQSSPVTEKDIDTIVSPLYKSIFKSVASHQQKNGVSARQNSVNLPLSSLNILCKHFGINFTFPYLGAEVNNAEAFKHIPLGTFNDKNFQEWDFFKNVQEVEENLGVGTLNANLHSTEMLICTKPPRARL